MASLTEAQKRSIKRFNTKPMKGTTKCRVSRVLASGVAVMSYHSDGKARTFRLSKGGGVIR